MRDQDAFYTVRGYQLLSQRDKLLTSGMEDYLEMIYRNMEKEGYIRISAISQLLNVKPSSATKMVQKLATRGLVDYQKYGIIFLTEEGKRYGKFLLERHNVIEKFLKTIGISENLLAETELIEHNISKNTMKHIDWLNQFMELHPEIICEFKKFKGISKTECTDEDDVGEK
ncbi:MAG: DtxR family transcriptional regulator [Clostridiaceae bacterium]|jgi:Mn-dependent DtxR family transcriptional regulator|nr:DtxR family transcriptional regulator [Clostridiaceae bacterium]